MSWTKNTIQLSVVNDLIERLKKDSIPYRVTMLGKVQGNGLNDLSRTTEEYKTYVLRRLDYEDKIILEQIIQSTDMQLDDFVFSHLFNKKEIPKSWKYKVKK